MEKTADGGLVLTAGEVEGVLSLILHLQQHVVSISATTFPAINDFVDEWVRVMGPIPERFR